jgi:enoyl-CoA hydratase/carnithine racemase
VSSHISISKVTPAYWRVTFDHPPINTITLDTIRDLSGLVDTVETDPEVRVVVFDSANPDFFLAHYGVGEQPEDPTPIAEGPTGLDPFLDVYTRISRLPAATIVQLRGAARGAGSEFILACDMRFASAEHATLGQFEVGSGLTPGGGALTRLPHLLGRGRALEVILGADDLDAAAAEAYGYINRALPDDRLDQFVDRLARRISSFARRLWDASEWLTSVRSPLQAVPHPS